MQNGIIHVVLSRRNLRTLLIKLDGYPPDSEMSIIGPDQPETPPFKVSAEEDEVHYNHPDRLATGAGAAGPMHPDTEARL
jgi:hypothetical protein